MCACVHRHVRVRAQTCARVQEREKRGAERGRGRSNVTNPESAHIKKKNTSSAVSGPLFLGAGAMSLPSAHALPFAQPRLAPASTPPFARAHHPPRPGCPLCVEPTSARCPPSFPFAPLRRLSPPPRAAKIPQTRDLVRPNSLRPSDLASSIPGSDVPAFQALPPDLQGGCPRPATNRRTPRRPTASPVPCLRMAPRHDTRTKDAPHLNKSVGPLAIDRNALVEPRNLLQRRWGVVAEIRVPRRRTGANFGRRLP